MSLSPAANDEAVIANDDDARLRAAPSFAFDGMVQIDFKALDRNGERKLRCVVRFGGLVDHVSLGDSTGGAGREFE